jgi:putative two-component system response regulator
MNRELMEVLTTDIGYTSVLASCGVEALELLDADIDLVLLDAMMPGMNGFEVTRKMRAHAQFGNVPIILVTALDSKRDRQHAIDAGANDFVAKPVSKTELLLRCAPLIENKRSQEAVVLPRQTL